MCISRFMGELVLRHECVCVVAVNACAEFILSV